MIKSLRKGHQHATELQAVPQDGIDLTRVCEPEISRKFEMRLQLKRGSKRHAQEAGKFLSPVSTATFSDVGSHRRCGRPGLLGQSETFGARIRPGQLVYRINQQPALLPNMQAAKILHELVILGCVTGEKVGGVWTSGPRTSHPSKEQGWCPTTNLSSKVPNSRLTSHVTRLTSHVSRRRGFRFSSSTSRLTPHVSRLRPHAPRLRSEDSRLTSYDSRLTPHYSPPTTHHST